MATPEVSLGRTWGFRAEPPSTILLLSQPAGEERSTNISPSVQPKIFCGIKSHSHLRAFASAFLLGWNNLASVLTHISLTHLHFIFLKAQKSPPQGGFPCLLMMGFSLLAGPRSGPSVLFIFHLFLCTPSSPLDVLWLYKHLACSPSCPHHWNSIWHTIVLAQEYNACLNELLNTKIF